MLRSFPGATLRMALGCSLDRRCGILARFEGRGGPEPHLYLHHLQLAFGVEPFDVHLGGGDLSLRLARTEFADGLGLV